MELNDPLLFIREQSKSMFPDGKVSGSVLMSNIAFGAAALGAGHVEICNAENWWFAASETNWLARDLPMDTTVEELFSSRIKFPSLGPNSYRPELYVGAYGRTVYLSLASKTKAVKGKLPSKLPHLDVVPPWCIYVLGCLIEEEAF